MDKRFNAADKESILESEKQREEKRRQELADISIILRTESGVRFFRRLFEMGMVFRTTFTGNSHTYFNEGHRNFALMFVKDVREAAPKKFNEILEMGGEDE